jgi:hypothetical protein
MSYTRHLWSRVGRAFGWLACLAFSANVVAAVLLHLEASLDKPSLDSRASLPNYQDVDWANAHFREFAELVTVHHSYVGWRRLPFWGETIEIDDDGVRRTYADPAAKPTETIAFSAVRRCGARAPTTSARFPRRLPRRIRNIAPSTSAKQRIPRIKI